MGFFSAECDGCHKSVLSIYVVNGENDWMQHVVAIKEDGSFHAGVYDGYGRIDDAEYAILDATVYHRACWELAGKPLDFTGVSASAQDQGYFYDDEDYAIPDPRGAA